MSGSKQILYSLARGRVGVLKVKYNLLPDFGVVDIGHSLCLPCRRYVVLANEDFLVHETSTVKLS